MEDLKAKLKYLLGDLYIKTYAVERYITCTINSPTFSEFVLNDVRLHELYNAYKSKNNVDIDKKTFIRREPEMFMIFIHRKLLDMPLDVQPDELFPDKEYPFKFEVLRQSYDVPTFEDFVMNINAAFMRKTGNYLFGKLTEEELHKRLIDDLEYKIKLKDIEIKQRKEETKPPKKIYKYDKDGNFIKMYIDRATCCEAEGFKKAALSLHLKGERKTLGGYIYKEIIG